MSFRTLAFALAMAWCLLDSHGEIARGHCETTSNKASAEALFNEGRRLVQVGQLAQACQKFAASEKLEPAVGTLLNLASCNERQGRIASAWANYRDAAGLAKGRGENDRQDFAAKRA